MAIGFSTGTYKRSPRQIEKLWVFSQVEYISNLTGRSLESLPKLVRLDL